MRCFRKEHSFIYECAEGAEGIGHVACVFRKDTFGAKVTTIYVLMCALFCTIFLSVLCSVLGAVLSCCVWWSFLLWRRGLTSAKASF